MFWIVKNRSQSDTQGILYMKKKIKTENINTPYQKPVYRLEDAYWYLRQTMARQLSI